MTASRGEPILHFMEHTHGPGCRHAHDQDARAAETLSRAESRCREQGARLTPIRRAVLSELLADHHPLGAYDLVERVSKREGRRLAPISVYRALDFLLDSGLAHRLSSRNAFVACPHSHAPGEAVAFLICDGCGGVDELSTPDIARALSAAADSAGFSPRRQTIELSGLCEHCRAGEATALQG